MLKRRRLWLRNIIIDGYGQTWSGLGYALWGSLANQHDLANLSIERSASPPTNLG